MPTSSLDNINFTLPHEPASNGVVLPGKRAASPKVYIGCPRWSVKEWKGLLYPKGTPDGKFLNEYAKQFTCIELNPTFYNLYDEGAIKKWTDKAGDNEFLFCPKVFQGISHEGSLIDKVSLMHQFERSVAAFGEHLGPAFLQLSDGFGPQRKNELQYFVQSLPTAMNLFVEVRHHGWFEAAEKEWLTDLLAPMNKGWLITDTAGRRDACHMQVAIKKTFIRFNANDLHPTDFTRIDAWVERIGYWIENGLEELYFIVHLHNEKHSPELVGYLVDGLNKRCGLGLKKPKGPHPLQLFL